MELIYITNVSELAAYAQRVGVGRVMIDLERMGKQKRQGHLDTLISQHSLDDIDALKGILDRSKLQVRVNPIHAGSDREIDHVISRGADIVMLPMFQCRDEVDAFVAMVNGRAETSLLLETPQALVRIDDILQVDGIDEVHIGLNDLHLGMNLDFMFELLSGGIVEYLSAKIRRRHIRFGFGGIARFGTGVVDPRLVLAEHVRLKSEMAFLSRTFHGGATSLLDLIEFIDFEDEISKVRNHCDHLRTLTWQGLDRRRHELSHQVWNSVRQRRGGKAETRRSWAAVSLASE